MSTLTATLDLKITFNDNTRRVHITFQSTAQAFAYSQYISQRSIVKRETLAVSQTGREVSLRLPSRVSQIVATTTYGGFCFVFDDAQLARDWARSFLVWKFYPQSERRLYVDRFVSGEALNSWVGIPSVPPAYRHVPQQQPVVEYPVVHLPGKALNSKGPRV